MSELKKTESNKETQAQKERGKYQLGRVSTIMDVLYALMIFRVFTLMPNPSLDHFDSTNVSEVLMSSIINYAAIAVAIVLILLYWNLNNIQFNNLTRTNGRHAVLSIIQVFFLMLYLYFVKLDLELEAPLIVMIMESVTLAIAGFISLYAWHYSNISKIVSESLTKEEKNQIYLKLMPEPIVSVLTIPFAYFGPGIWTASWLLLVPVGMLSKYFRSRIVKRPL